MTPNLSPQVQEWRKEAERLAMNLAHVYSFVGDDTMPTALEELRKHLNQVVQERLPRHKFWGAGEPDCPQDIKGANGELHTMRCKVCGDGWLKSSDVCFAAPVPARPVRMLPPAGSVGETFIEPRADPILVLASEYGGACMDAAPVKRKDDPAEFDRVYDTVNAAWLKLGRAILALRASVPPPAQSLDKAASPQPVSQPGEALPAEQPKSEIAYPTSASGGNDLQTALPEAPQTVWRAIGEEAECVVQGGRKYLLLSEEMCVRLGGALGM